MTTSPKRRTALRLLGFLVLAGAAFAGVGPAVGLASGFFGLGPGHPVFRWLYPALVSAAFLAVTWAALRSEGAALRSLGLVPTRRRMLEFAVGFATSAAVFVVVGLVRAASVGAGWTFDPAAGGQAALLGLPLAFVALFPEELLFRGYGFRKAEMLWGAGPALAASALAFGLYHVAGSGLWGMDAVYRFAMPMLGGLLFGVAMLRTGGLALPTGLHLGGNWINAAVLGLGVPEGDALWTASLTPAQVAALTAPDLLPHLPYLTAVAVLTAFVLVWRAPGPRQAVRT